jgi:hypothetical protein
VTRYLKHARFLAGVLALVVGLTFGAPPALAAGPATTADPRPIADAATAKVAALPAAALAQATPAAPSAAPASKPFLKTTKGAIALVLVAGALGMAFYSFGHDRVKSPAK